MAHPSDMQRRTSPGVAQALADGQTTAIIVLGAHEQHGAHLPLATDSLWGARLAEMIAEKIGGALVAPVLSVGYSPEHMRFPGTITLRAETWGAVVEDYVVSLEAHGFQRILLLASHGGNYAPLADELPGLRKRHPNVELVAYTDLLGLVEAAGEVADRYGVTRDEAGAHAGEWETSMMLAVEPETVHRDREEVGFMGALGPVLDRINDEGIHAVAPNGVLGDPAKASAEHGEAYLERMADLFVAYLNG
ncbi:MAG TPA: creatininase family protein [Thermomicrobiales bacterium]|nr:creatininase family protein [Thermomicrobiales bacterium]